jgi:hypothetical protein
MTDQDQFLIEMHKEQVTHGRHTETQRLEVTKFILAAAAALVGVMGVLKFSIHCIPVAAGVIYLGWFGRQITNTFIERFDGHMRRARALRQAVDSSAAKGAVQAIWDANPVVDRDPVARSRRVRSFWLRINNAIVCFGLICMAWNIGAVGARLSKQHGTFCEKLVDQLALTNLETPQTSNH